VPTSATTEKKKPASRGRKIVRMHGSEQDKYTKLTVYVQHKAKGNRRYGGIDPADTFQNSLLDFGYDGIVRDFAIVSENLTEAKYKEEVKAIG
jgi:hypothetical protein